MFSTNMAQNQAYQQEATAAQHTRNYSMQNNRNYSSTQHNQSPHFQATPQFYDSNFTNYNPPINSYENQHEINFKPLPVIKWNITFSGEEDRLELLDFLKKIDIFSSIESTPKNEVLRSAFYLFKGQAREWYMASRHRFDS
jgi:hypothetical protein